MPPRRELPAVTMLEEKGSILVQFRNRAVTLRIFYTRLTTDGYFYQAQR